MRRVIHDASAYAGVCARFATSLPCFFTPRARFTAAVADAAALCASARCACKYALSRLHKCNNEYTYFDVADAAAFFYYASTCHAYDYFDTRHYARCQLRLRR